MPLAAARKVVKAATAFTRDNGDELWLALLSLADAREFMRAAARIEWKFPLLRGDDNIDIVRRYGSGALPWLDAVTAKLGGVLQDPSPRGRFEQLLSPLRVPGAPPSLRPAAVTH